MFKILCIFEMSINHAFGQLWMWFMFPVITEPNMLSGGEH